MVKNIVTNREEYKYKTLIFNKLIMLITQVHNCSYLYL